MAAMPKQALLAKVYDMYDTDESQPKGSLLTHVVQSIENDWPCTEEPVLEFVADVEERRHLFNEFQALCNEQWLQLNAAALATFLLAPIGELRERTAASRENRDQLLSFHILVTQQSIGAARAFLARPCKPETPGMSAGSTPSTPARVATGQSDFSPKRPSPLSALALSAAAPDEAPESSKKRNAESPGTDAKHAAKHVRSSSDPVAGERGASSTKPQDPGFFPAQVPSPAGSSAAAKRSRMAPSLTRARDGIMCVLSRYTLPEVAHIFPFSASKAPDAAHHIKWFTLLWSSNMSDKWESLYRDPDITESPKNLICLNRHLHALWGGAQFGLKPLRSMSAAAGEIRVQFHWLPRSTYKPSDIVDDASAETLQKMLGSGRDSHHVAHRRSGLPIETGHVFTIKAADPADLPSFDLLELQWILTQLSALSGAADVYDNFDASPAPSPDRIFDEELSVLDLDEARGEAWDDTEEEYNSGEGVTQDSPL